MTTKLIPVRIDPTWREFDFFRLMVAVRKHGVGLTNGKSWSVQNDYEGLDGIKYHTLLRLSDPTLVSSESDIKRVSRSVKKLLLMVRASEPNFEDWANLIENSFRRLSENIEIGDSEFNLRDFARRFRSAARREIALIGSTYVDINVEPVAISNLSRDVSYTNLDAPRTRLGGGVVIFGENYSRLSGVSCDLYTVTGSSLDDFHEMHQKLLELSRSTWARNVEKEVGGSTPVAFHLFDRNQGSRCVFAYTGANRALINFDLGKIVGGQKYGIVFTSYPTLVKKKISVPCVVSYGYQTPGDIVSRDFDALQHILLSGNVDLLFGSFYEFARLWHLEPLTEKKWDRSVRKEILKRCFEDLKGHSVVVVRDYNYGRNAAGLNLFVIVNNIVIDLTDQLPTSSISPDGFFIDARKFDAALVNLLVNDDTTDTLDFPKFCDLINQACLTAFAPHREQNAYSATQTTT